MIDEHLKAARIILLLVSRNYLASKYLYDHEVKRAMEYHAAGTAKVVPVLLSPVHWKGTLFGKLGPLPADERPVSRWNDKSDAFYEIAEGVRGMIEQLVGPPQEETPSTAVAAEKSPPKEAGMANQPTTQEQVTFDVFLCHNSLDKPAVKEIAEQLRARGIKPWLDEWELRPGFPWQRVLEKQITQIKTAAVFVGSSGMGPWHQMELEAFLREFVRRECPVILVLLKNAPQEPDVPTFLGGMTRVDFRKQIPDPMEQLVWGITGENPHYKNARGSQQPQSQAPQCSLVEENLVGDLSHSLLRLPCSQPLTYDTLP